MPAAVGIPFSWDSAAGNGKPIISPVRRSRMSVVGTESEDEVEEVEQPYEASIADDAEAPKERTTTGQRLLKNSYLRVFQFRPLVLLPPGGSRTTPKLLRRGHSHPLIRGPLIFFDAPKERTKHILSSQACLQIKASIESPNICG